MPKNSPRPLAMPARVSPLRMAAFLELGAVPSRKRTLPSSMGHALHMMLPAGGSGQGQDGWMESRRMAGGASMGEQ
eukprot:218685-Hanusia_phi.AAC.1